MPISFLPRRFPDVPLNHLIPFTDSPSLRLVAASCLYLHMLLEDGVSCWSWPGVMAQAAASDSLPLLPWIYYGSPDLPARTAVGGFRMRGRFCLWPCSARGRLLKASIPPHLHRSSPSPSLLPRNPSMASRLPPDLHVRRFAPSIPVDPPPCPTVPQTLGSTVDNQRRIGPALFCGLIGPSGLYIAGPPFRPMFEADSRSKANALLLLVSLHIFETLTCVFYLFEDQLSKSEASSSLVSTGAAVQAAYKEIRILSVESESLHMDRATFLGSCDTDLLRIFEDISFLTRSLVSFTLKFIPSLSSVKILSTHSNLELSLEYAVI